MRKIPKIGEKSMKNMPRRRRFSNWKMKNSKKNSPRPASKAWPSFEIFFLEKIGPKKNRKKAWKAEAGKKENNWKTEKKEKEKK